MLEEHYEDMSEDDCENMFYPHISINSGSLVTVS